MLDREVSPTAPPCLTMPTDEGTVMGVFGVPTSTSFADIPSPVAPTSPTPSAPPRSFPLKLPIASLQASQSFRTGVESEGTATSSMLHSGETMVANSGNTPCHNQNAAESTSLNNQTQSISYNTSSCSSRLDELGILSPKSPASGSHLQPHWALPSYRSSKSSAGHVNSGASEVGSTSSRIFGSRRMRTTQKSGHSAGDLLSDAEVVGALTEQISFKGIEDLLRGVRLYQIMRGGASVFRHSAGSSETYNLSERVPSIKYFISHNWSVSRWDKLLALGFKFNFHAAFAVGLFFCALIAALGRAGLMPHLPDVAAEENAHAVGYVARLSVPIVMMITFLFGSEILGLCGCHGPHVFLDKVCIHQTDLALQKDAIARLGAFLRASERMMILYSDVYLRKLWTIYEVANFLTLRNMDAIDLVPVTFPRSLLFMMPLSLFYHSLMLPVRYYKSVGLLQYVALATAAFVHLSIVRRWLSHKRSTQEMLAEFKVQQCTCTVESDREVIYQKIAALMRATRRVDRTASIEDALEAFNLEVRTRMPTAFGGFLDDMSFRYYDYLFMGIPLVLAQSADYMAQSSEVGYQRVIAGRSHELLWFMTLWPLNFVMTEAVVCRFPKLSGWRERAWVCCSVACGGIPSSYLHAILMPWETRASTDEMAYYSFLTMVATTCSLTVLFVLLRTFICRRFCCRNGKKKQKSNTKDESEHWQRLQPQKERLQSQTLPRKQESLSQEKELQREQQQRQQAQQGSSPGSSNEQQNEKTMQQQL